MEKLSINLGKEHAALIEQLEMTKRAFAVGEADLKRKDQLIVNTADLLKRLQIEGAITSERV
ncbi:hypothetical protein KIN20_017211 [Parelaphostrongylus tenuis]|uniref:Uncharacterized protein n=1 Tax=Parelaphostrongylus tenuis TaxID=148309 RepID=A0AAD5MI99_PARTN|nr:hypothetical protein KIN20_017211 [Parelaphostrongylus tenuis]